MSLIPFILINGESDPVESLSGDPTAPVTGLAPLGGIQLWTGDPNDSGSSQVMGAGVSILQNPTGLDLQWVVGGSNDVSITHTLIAVGLSPSAYDGVNVLLNVIPSPSPTGSPSPAKASAPATVPAAAGSYDVTDVVFNATNATDFHTIARDNGTGNYLGSWHDASGTGDMSAAGSHADPLCYTSSGGPDGNVYYSFQAWIKSTGTLTSDSGKYIIEAFDIDSGLVVGQGYATPNVTTGTLQAAFSSTGLARVVSTVDRGFLDLEWLVSPDGHLPADQRTWSSAGDTNDKVYVTNENPDGLTAGGDAAVNASGDPDTTAPVDPIPETVLDIGCRSAQGETLDANILNDVWNAFAAPAAGTPKLADAEGNVMTYWAGHAGPYRGNLEEFFTAEGLIQYHDGRCGAWSRLLISVLAAQGITSQRVSVTVNSTFTTGLGNSVTSFHVKPTLAAQGAPTPWNYFSNHAVVTLTGSSAALAPLTIFDPSYGQKYAVGGATTFADAEQAWETASVADVVDAFPLVPGRVVPTEVTPAMIKGPPVLFSFVNLSGAAI